MKIGIIKEGKVPIDKRVAFTPRQAKEIQDSYQDVKVICEPSDIRGFKDDEYQAEGIEVSNNIQQCDWLFGIKEVPINQLIPNKTYCFFSHTMKKQPYNRKLLQEILKQNIRLIDYEVLKDKQGNRLVAFGRYAGIVGAYNALWTYGKRYGTYTIRRAKDCFDLEDMQTEYAKVKLGKVKIVLTGSGRVGNGSKEVLLGCNIKQVSAEDFLTKDFDYPVFTQLSSKDYHQHKEGKAFDRNEFHQNPERYTSDFLKFAHAADVFIGGAYWDPKAPVLFTKADIRNPKFRIKVIADITCDIEGSIPTTLKPSSIDNPIYDYNPISEQIEDALSSPENITVMAIDNLPCELPRSASTDFGRDLIDKVMPHIIQGDTENIMQNATIAQNGKLTAQFAYLQDYVSESK
ncbi:MAG TPA: NAD(P)-dependent oxidoreductase [Cyclobacteriaceae bacterium]|nr:NAD(P)-dependent oxidoreductase [Cyclobacteriaceae bacterium]